MINSFPVQAWSVFLERMNDTRHPAYLDTMSPREFIAFEAQLFRWLSDDDKSKTLDLIQALAPRLREFAENRRYRVTADDLVKFVQDEFLDPREKVQAVL